MNNFKILLGICLLFFGLVLGGCNMFPNNQTRPAPVRPRVTITPSPTPNMKSTPTKRIKGLTSITENQLTSRVAKIEQAITKGNWSVANKETNTLGLEMAKFRPASAKGKTLKELADFDSIYAKLQADVKVNNKTAALQDIKRLRTALQELKKTA